MNTQLEHPAVKCHWDFCGKLDLEYNDSSNVPNHEQLVPYLRQLPHDVTYKVVDTEAHNVPLDYGDNLEPIGLDVMWGDIHGNYGGCQMVVAPGGRVGLMIYVNGCPLASAPTYYIMQE